MPRRIKAAQIDLHYREAGQGEAILFINGLATDLTVWSAQLADLSKDYRVILFDNRGTGLSGRPEGDLSTELLADDVANLLSALGIPSAILVGHSLGGLIAQHVALRHPACVQRLVLASTFCRAPKRAQFSLHLWADVLERMGIKAFVDLMIAQNYSMGYIEQNYRQVLFLRRLLVTHFQEVPLDPAVLRRYIDLALAHNTERELHRIRVPTLVVVGDQDFLISPRLAKELAERIPGASFELIADAAHNLMLEQPEEFNRRLRRFMENPPKGMAR